MGGASITEELTDILDRTLALLGAGASDPAHPFHILTLASRGADGAPGLRSVVLRAFDTASRHLEIHTDTRSAKHRELTAHPRAALHGWDPHSRLQLRLSGHATLHAGDAIAASAWAGLRQASRATYRVQPGPGTPIATPGLAVHETGDTLARRVFCVIRIHVDCMEYLHLEQGSHRRARFQWDSGRLTAMWLVP